MLNNSKSSSNSAFRFKTLTKCKWRALALSQSNASLALGRSGVSNFALVGQKIKKKCPLSQPISNFALYVISIKLCNRMRPSRINDKFSRVFSKFSQNCPSLVATRAICENFENTSENLSLILRGLNAITCL